MHKIMDYCDNLKIFKLELSAYSKDNNDNELFKYLLKFKYLKKIKLVDVHFKLKSCKPFKYLSKLKNLKYISYKIYGEKYIMYRDIIIRLSRYKIDAYIEEIFTYGIKKEEVDKYSDYNTCVSKYNYRHGYDNNDKNIKVIYDMDDITSLSPTN